MYLGLTNESQWRQILTLQPPREDQDEVGQKYRSSSKGCRYLSDQKWDRIPKFQLFFSIPPFGVALTSDTFFRSHLSLIKMYLEAYNLAYGEHSKSTLNHVSNS